MTSRIQGPNEVSCDPLQWSPQQRWNDLAWNLSGWFKMRTTLSQKSLLLWCKVMYLSYICFADCLTSLESCLKTILDLEITITYNNSQTYIVGLSLKKHMLDHSTLWIMTARDWDIFKYLNWESHLVVIYWTDLFSMEIHQLSRVTRNNEFYNPTRQSPSWGALKNEREMFEYLRQKMYPLISHIWKCFHLIKYLYH